MTQQEEEAFYQDLLNDFRSEASEHHETISQGLMALERFQESDQHQAQIELVFRATHSLKGAARAVNLLNIERLSSHLESVFHHLKSGSLKYSAEMHDVLFQSIDILGVMIPELGNASGSVTEDDIRITCNELDGLITQCRTGVVHTQPTDYHEDILHKNLDEAKHPLSGTDYSEEHSISFSHSGEPVENANKGSGHETVRIPLLKIHDLLLQTEELLHIKGRLHHQQSMAENAILTLESLQRYCKRTDAIEPLEDLTRIREELRKIHHETDQSGWLLSRLIDTLSGSIKDVLLQPFGTLLRIVPRLVRDLSRGSGKEVEYVVSGSDVMVDRRILEILKDPLIHLIRNSIDHGIEFPEIRISKGKEPRGRIEIRVQEDIEGMVRMEVSDDGAGIDSESVVKAAVESGLVRPEDIESMTEEEKQMLIFSSGVTTARYITDISGRGLGMAIVSSAITDAGGQISLKSKAGAGTLFEILLPKTIAAAKGLLVRAGDQLFLIPFSHIEKAVSIRTQDIETVEGRKVIRLHQERYGLVHLCDILSLRKSSGNAKQEIPGVLLNSSGVRMVFMVDAIEDEFEGVVKPLGSLLDGFRHVAGVCLLGSGQMVCVLQTPDLIESAVEYLRGQMPQQSVNSPDTLSTDRKRILVAEDSITVRNMLKSYLTASGYDVTTAVDGAEAFEKLRKNVFDIVVSDVEMPGMSGFDLTKKIRNDSTLFKLPVVLVTALESADDKRKGLECGANAYIVKSSFEKSNLVEAIQRLI